MPRPRESLALKPVTEIAEEIGMSVGAVNALLSRALRKLRSQGLICTCREFAEALDANRKGIVE